jgi:pimeloyl-ACP methyl ester carboxylesterase
LHGGAQNAHTWDSVALALEVPIVAIDLPGHGQSEWRIDHEYGVSSMSADVVEVVRRLAGGASVMVGIGLGSSVALLAADRLKPAINRLVLVDSAPGAGISQDTRAPSEAAASVAAFTAQHHFTSLDEMLARAKGYSPHRSEQSLRRGVVHNARQMPDGSWEWRWDPEQRNARDYARPALEESLARFAGPILLVRGGRSDIVTDQVAEAFRQRHNSTRLMTIDGAAHAVQGGHPVELAEAIRSFLLQGQGGQPDG